MKRWLGKLSRWAFFALMMLGSALITWASLVYFDSNVVAPFVIEKLPVRFETLWLWSLKVHVASAIVAFPACLVLMTRAVQRRKALHRWLGRVTGLLVVFALVPSGIVLAFEAKGGAPVTWGFILSALIVLWGMGAGISAARRKQMAKHAYAMRHVLSQMSVAVTSRAMLIGLNVAGMHPDTAYVLALWAPVLGSALFVEIISGASRIFQPFAFQPTPRSLS